MRYNTTFLICTLCTYSICTLMNSNISYYIVTWKQLSLFHVDCRDNLKNAKRSIIVNI